MTTSTHANFKMSKSTKIFAIVAASILIFAFLFTSGQSAAVTVRRSVRQSTGNAVEEEECRTNAVCGWQVYNASNRVHQRYVSTTCRCAKKDLCTRAEDDIGVPAYVYRCRDYSSRRRTTLRPAGDTSGTSSS